MDVHFYFHEDLKGYGAVAEYFKKDGGTYVNESVRMGYCEKSYQVLVLPYEESKIEDVDLYKSKSAFDAFAFISKSRDFHDLINLRDTFLEIMASPGVLRKEQIECLLDFHMLFYGISDPKAMPAKYELTLNGEYYSPFNPLGGVDVSRSGDICINPLSFVLVMANEVCNFPKNICGIFDLKVTLFCNGIILSNGVQVDPGYRGVLLSLLFNSGSHPHLLKVGSVFAGLMFFSLSKKGSACYTGSYLNSKTIQQYMPHSSPGGFSYSEFKNISKEVNTLKKGYGDLKKYFENLNSATIEERVARSEARGWKWTSVLLSFVAIVIAVAAGSPIAYHYSRIDSFEDKISKLESRVENISSICSIEKVLDGVVHGAHLVPSVPLASEGVGGDDLVLTLVNATEGALGAGQSNSSTALPLSAP